MSSRRPRRVPLGPPWSWSRRPPAVTRPCDVLCAMTLAHHSLPRTPGVFPSLQVELRYHEQYTLPCRGCTLDPFWLILREKGLGKGVVATHGAVGKEPSFFKPRPPLSSRCNRLVLAPRHSPEEGHFVVQVQAFLIAVDQHVYTSLRSVPSESRQ